MDQIVAGPNGEGIECLWEFTRSLHVTEVVSQACLNSPATDADRLSVELLDRPVTHATERNPDVTFVIGIVALRGFHTVAHAYECRGQAEVSVECIVVEQDWEPHLKDRLPGWVRYHFSKTPSPEYLYNRSWALNEGARLAEAQSLFCMMEICWFRHSTPKR